MSRKLAVPTNHASVLETYVSISLSSDKPSDLNELVFESYPFGEGEVLNLLGNLEEVHPFEV
jgi:hypothetical protein